MINKGWLSYVVNPSVLTDHIVPDRRRRLSCRVPAPRDGCLPE